MYVSSYYYKCVLKLSRQIVKGWLVGLFIGTQAFRAHPSPASYREKNSWYWVTFPQAWGGEKRAFLVLIIYHLRLNPLATNLPYMTEKKSWKIWKKDYGIGIITINGSNQTCRLKEDGHTKCFLLVLRMHSSHFNLSYCLCCWLWAARGTRDVAAAEAVACRRRSSKYRYRHR